MITRRSLVLPIATLLVALGLPVAAAAERTLVLDPEASRLSFTLDTTLHEVHGTLFLAGGEVRFDPDTGAAAGTITVDARRTDTGNAKRDKKMHNSVLESVAYPQFVFQLERVEGRLAPRGRSELDLVGTMTVHGEGHPMTLRATVELDGDRARVDSRFSIPYVDWGMSNPSLLFLRVAKQVEVSILAEGRLDGVQAQAR
jgi:polyisoprenoid-binding protein YceI